MMPQPHTEKSKLIIHLQKKQQHKAETPKKERRNMKIGQSSSSSIKRTTTRNINKLKQQKPFPKLITSADTYAAQRAKGLPFFSSLVFLSLH